MKSQKEIDATVEEGPTKAKGQTFTDGRRLIEHFEQKKRTDRSYPDDEAQYRATYWGWLADLTPKMSVLLEEKTDAEREINKLQDQLRRKLDAQATRRGVYDKMSNLLKSTMKAIDEGIDETSLDSRTIETFVKNWTVK